MERQKLKDEEELCRNVINVAKRICRSEIIIKDNKRTNQWSEQRKIRIKKRNKGNNENGKIKILAELVKYGKNNLEKQKLY